MLRPQSISLATGHGRKSDRRVGARAEQKRRWDREQRHPCSECGEPAWGVTGRCQGCHRRHLGQQRTNRRTEIQRLWAEGRKLREIAAAMDSTQGAIGVEITKMRADGWDLPHRIRVAA